jgi:carboxylesterase type B
MTTVVTSGGRISGHVDGKVVAYQGIPYAAAPRFAAPQPREPWTGVFAADTPGAGAPDNPFGACHCIDLPFTFDTFPSWPDAPMLAGRIPRPPGRS